MADNCEDDCNDKLSANKIFLKNAIGCLNIESCERLDIILEIFGSAICQALDTEMCDIVMEQRDAFELLGDPLLFTSPDYGTEVDVIETGVTAITRGDNDGIFNPLTEGAYIGGTSPGNTEWNTIYTDPTLNGFTTLGDIESRVFSDFDTATNGNPFANVVGLEMVMHDLTTDKYYTFVFSAYSEDGNGGGFAYTRQEFALIAPCMITFSDGTTMSSSPIDTQSVVIGGTDITVTPVTVGNTTTYTVSADGKGIVSILWTSNSGGQPQGTQGTTDTYTITYTDATTDNILVTNGADGTLSWMIVNLSPQSITDVVDQGLIIGTGAINFELPATATLGRTALIVGTNQVGNHTITHPTAGVYISGGATSTTPGAGGSLTIDVEDTVELVYTGANRWNIVRHYNPSGNPLVFV